MKIIIDIITLAFIILNLVYIPIELSFSIQSEDYLALHIATNHFTLIMFLFEIICHLNTAIYVNGLIISDRKEIIKNYFKKMLWWDLFIIIPLCAGIYFDIVILKLIIVLRFFDILNLVQDIEDRFQFKDRFRGQLQLFKLMAFILCLAHLIACTWNKLADIQFQYGYTQTWVGNVEQGSNLQFLKQYIRSIYWTVVTMTTLGYGDITPKTTRFTDNQQFVNDMHFFKQYYFWIDIKVEQVFATSIGLLSTVVFAFSVSMIGEILKDISKKQSEFRSKMSTIETYMNRRKLNQQLQVKVRKYFDYLHKEEQEDTNEGNELLQKLATSLKEEVFVDMYGRLLKSKKIFDLHFSQPFLNQLALKMKEMRLGPEEIIYRENEPGNKIYFILKGEVQMLLNMKQESQHYHMLCNLKEGQIFGEVEFFSGLVRENTARTLHVTSLVYVEYEDFIETVKAFPEDYEQVLQTKDNINLYNKSKGLDHKCFSCSSFDHRLKSCPLVNYIPNRAKIMYNFNLYYDQMRNDVTTRKDYRAGKTLKQIKYLKQCAMRLHFYLYNEQLLNEEEFSQLDFDVDSEDNLCNQSNSFVYHQSPQVMTDKYSQAGHEIQRGFTLNNSFIAAETPKHQQKLTRISTMLLKGNSKHFNRSNTQKFMNGLPLSEPNSHNVKKQDSKSKFFRQTQCISQIPGVKENLFQTDHPNQENIVKELSFSDSKCKQKHPFQLSSKFSNTPYISNDEPINNDDFNNFNDKQFQNNNNQLNIKLDKSDFQPQGQPQRKQFKQTLRRQKLNFECEKSDKQSNLSKQDENTQTPFNQNQSNQDNNNKSMSSINQIESHVDVSGQLKSDVLQSDANKSEILKSNVLKQNNQTIIENPSQRNIKNVNFEKIKPNVQFITFQNVKSNDYYAQNKDIDSPDQYKSSYLKQQYKTNYSLFNKKNQQCQEQSFKKALSIQKENIQITSLEEILSLAHTPKTFNPNKQSYNANVKSDKLTETSIQLNDQQQNLLSYQQYLTVPTQYEEKKEYAKPHLLQRNQNQEQDQNQINEVLLSKHFNYHQQADSQNQPQFNFRVQVKSPESPPPAQERIKRKKKRNKKQQQQLHNISSPIALKLLKVPIINSTNLESQNNSEATNYGENLTTQRTNDKVAIAQDGVSQNCINPSLSESNINSVQNTNNENRKPSLFINSSLIIDVEKMKNKVYSQNSRVSQSSDRNSSDNYEGEDSSDSDSSSSSFNDQESFGDNSYRENKENSKILMNHDLSQVHSVYSQKPQINIIKDEEVIISDYKQFKRNIKSKPHNPALSGDSNFLGSDMKRFEIDSNIAKNYYNSQYYNQGHETPQFESTKNQLQKHQKFSTSSNNLDNKKTNNSFQSDYEKCNQKNKQSRININFVTNSPKNSSKYGVEKTSSQNNLNNMKSSPCLPQDLNNLQQQMKMFSQMQLKQNNNFYNTLNTPIPIIRSNSKVIDMNSNKTQSAANRLYHLKRTETITTNNSPHNVPHLTMDHKKRSSEILIPAEPCSANQMNQQNYQATHQYESSPARCEREEFNVRVIRDSVENFDKFKIFKKYFVFNNLDVVINQINKKRKNKAIVQKIRQFNIRKKKTLIAVNKLNIKRSGAITDNNNSAQINIKKQLTSYLQPSATFRNTTLQKIQSTQSENIQHQQNDKSQIIKQTTTTNNIFIRSDLKINNDTNDKNNISNHNINENNNIIIENQKNRQSDQIQSLLFLSDQNLLVQQNSNTNILSSRKSQFFANKELKSSEENQTEEKVNLIAPPIQLSSNFLSPKRYSDVNQSMVSKSAGITNKTKQ